MHQWLIKMYLYYGIHINSGRTLIPEMLVLAQEEIIIS